MAHSSRNPEVAPGIGKYSRSAMYKKRAMYKRKKVSVKKDAKKAETTKSVPVGGAKNGGTRVVQITKKPRFYPADDVPKPLVRRVKPKAGPLRGSITPGTVLILLAGRFQSKRVVFLKQLASGLLLVTGPFQFNGVPLRRVNQSYVIATSTKVDISKVAIPANIDDKYFAKVEAAEKKDFLEKDKKASTVSEQRKADQAAVDAGIVAAIKAVPNLKAYVSTPFGLSNGQQPHLMKF